MSNNIVDALDEANAHGTTFAGEWLDYCTHYSYVTLIAAGLFLAAGLVWVVVAAYNESRKAKAEADRARAEAEKAQIELEEAARQAAAAAQEAAAEGAGADEIQRRAAEAARSAIPVSVLVGAAKGFADVLNNAKAWVAAIVIGLVLLLMAGSAPHLCSSGAAPEPDGQNETANTANEVGNEAGNDTDNAVGNGVGNEANAQEE